jgi:alkylation response protein AidB-like acyl-CoA dehydrogenase
MCDSRRPDCVLSPIVAIAQQSRRASLTLRGVDFELDGAQQAWPAEVREFLQQNVTDELRAEIAGHGLDWPREYGGLGLGAVHQHLLMREFQYRGVPGPDPTVTSVAPMIMRHG